MKKQQVIQFLVLLALVAGPVHAFPVTDSVPPASFLDFHVDTVPQLAFEVAYDPAVRARLARHFHMTGPAMSAYVRRNLVLSHLKAPLKTRVYCVAPSGHEYYVVMTLPKGFAVFSQRGAGKPVLRLACGNPLTAVLPPPPPSAATDIATPVKTEVESALEQRITSGMATPAVLNATFPASALPAALPVINTASAGEVLWTAGSGSSLGWLPLAGGIAAGGVAVGVVAQQLSGGSSGPGPIPLQPTPPQAAPEPNPGVVMLLGVLSLAAWRLPRSRREK